MNEIGITGATGILGKILVGKLNERNLKCSSFNGDICSKKDIGMWLDRNKFTAIIHFAAIVSIVDVRENLDKAHNVNIIGTENLIDEIKSSKQSPWLFYASTSHIYKSKSSPINEDDEKEPILVSRGEIFRGKRNYLRNHW